MNSTPSTPVADANNEKAAVFVDGRRVTAAVPVAEAEAAALKLRAQSTQESGGQSTAAVSVKRLLNG